MDQYSREFIAEQAARRAGLAFEVALIQCFERGGFG